MPQPEKVLITGASGLLGANLVRHYAADYETTGWFATRSVPIAGARMDLIELTDHSSVALELDRLRPDLIIHCAAATNVEWCERNPDLARAINEDATKFLAEKAVEIGAKFIFTSTDSVFDGKTGHYSENDVTGPLNAYAAGKVRSEIVVATVNPDALIIRSYFYGHSPAGNRSLLEWVLVRALAGDPVPGFTDSFFSPISIHDFASALDAAIDAGTSGLLHLGSNNAISKYEFARMVMEAYDCDMSLLRPIKVDDIGLKADRPRNTSLNVQLLESILGKPVSMVAEAVKQIAGEPSPFR